MSIATPSTNHLAPPSNLSVPNSNNDCADAMASPPASGRNQPPPSPRTRSRSILTIALEKAQTAVLLDSANNVGAALVAYKQTVKLLTQVIEKAANTTDLGRLQLIHDTYADRIRLLSTIAPDSDETEDNGEYELQHPHNGFEYRQNQAHVNQHGSADSSGGPSIQINSIPADSRIQQKATHSDNALEKAFEMRPSTQLKYDSETGSGSEEADLITVENNDTFTLKEQSKDFITKIDTSHINGIANFEQKKSEKHVNAENTILQMIHQNRPTHKPNSSTAKSWNSSRKSYTLDKSTLPISDYESAVEGRKSAVETPEPSTSSDDSGSSSEDISVHVTNDFVDQKGAVQRKFEKEMNMKLADESFSTSTITNKLEQQSTLLDPASISPPPPNVFIPNDISTKPSETTIMFAPSRSPTLSHNESIMEHVPIANTHEKRTLPSIQKSTLSLKSQKTPNLSQQISSSSFEHEDDFSSMKTSRPDASTAPNATIMPATRESATSSGSVHKSVEKLAGKTSPNRRPSPLPLIQHNNYNSRTVPVVRSPSNPSLLAVTPTTAGLIGVAPRRAISNPGQPRKNKAIRFLQNTAPNAQALPSSPNSPWINSFNLPSPSLKSPMFSPSGIYRSDSARSLDPGYASMVDSNPLIFDDDTALGNQAKKGIPDSPGDIHLRPFWLMRILERTMTTGGYLTKKLFVPNNMWVQANVKLPAVETKLSSCEVIYNCLLRLEKTSIDDLDRLVKELDSIEPLFDGIQNTLARKLSYVETTSGKSRQSTSIKSWGSKLSQRLDRMGMGNVANRSEEASSYVELLSKVFQTAEVVEIHIRHFSSLKAPYHHHHTHIVTRLYKIADFFGNVVCRFVIRDLGVLADKYVKRGGNWVTN